METKLPQNRLPRILKALIGKKLVKELPVLTGNKQKIYLLFELEPSSSLAANTLFAGEAGVDREFVAMLRTACLKYMQDKVYTLTSIQFYSTFFNLNYKLMDTIFTQFQLCERGIELPPIFIKIHMLCVNYIS